MTHLTHSGRSAPILFTPGRKGELRRIGPFLCVGLVGLAVDVGLFSAAAGFGLSRPLARAASLGLATVVTFVLNRSFTFAATGRRSGGEFLRYGLVTLLVQGGNYGLFLLLSAAAPRLPAVAALIGCAVLATGFSFAGQRLFTFRTDAPSRPASRPR